MRINHIISLVVICTSLFSLFHYIKAKTIEVKSEKEFYSALEKQPYAVTYFYQETRQDKKNKEVRADNEALKKMMAEVSNRPLYKDADLKFMGINIGKNNLDDIAQSFNVQKVPALLLLSDSEPIVADGNMAMLETFTNKTQVKSFIDDHLHDSLANYAQEKADACRRASATYYYGPTWCGYGYPGYCGWPYYDNFPYSPWCGTQYYYGPWNGPSAGVSFGVWF